MPGPEFFRETFTPMPTPATDTRLPIIFCPVCCSPDDAPTWGHVVMVCQACGTQYALTLDATIVAAHSIS